MTRTRPLLLVVFVALVAPSVEVKSSSNGSKTADRRIQFPASQSTNGVVDRTRPLCPFPQVAAYTGSGSVNEAANFVCRVP